MISIAKERGVYMGPVKTARVFSSLSKIKFKNIAHKMITSLGYIIETEFIYKEGVDFIGYKRNARKQDKVFFRIRKWSDVIPVENIKQFNQDVKASRVPVRTKMLVTCGKYSKKAKEFAEKYSIKLYDDRIVTKILSRLAEM
jgi:restriction endonuclease Mrr